MLGAWVEDGSLVSRGWTAGLKSVMVDDKMTTILPTASVGLDPCPP